MTLLTRFIPTKKWRKAALLGLSLLVLAGACAYSYVQHGFSLNMLYTVAAYSASYIYVRFGLKSLGSINYQLLFPMGFTLLISFLLWDPSEHLSFGSDAEYPHIAGLAFGMTAGFIVVLTKASEDNDDGTLLGAIRAMRHYLVTLSFVAVAGYAMFLPYAFAMYQVLTEGNYIFALLAFFSVVAFLALAHNQAKATTED